MKLGFFRHAAPSVGRRSMELMATEVIPPQRGGVGQGRGMRGCAGARNIFILAGAIG